MNGQVVIEEMFACIVTDDDGTEDVPAVPAPSGLMLPLVGADLSRIESLKPVIQEMANVLKKEIRICKFSVREQLYTIQPEGRLPDDPTST